MKQLWSTSTTMRNPERVYGFLSTIAEMEGKEWNKNNQEELQIRLIKNRLYTPQNKDKQGCNILDEEMQKKFDDLSYNLTYNEAKKNFKLNNYEDPPMRGRTSFDPVEKIGLVAVKENKIVISDIGKKYLSGKIELSDVMLSYLLKFQYPNPLMKGFKEYNTKPFINTLKLILFVNEKCKERKIKIKGISKLEFGIFALSLINYEDVENVANTLLLFREELSKIIDERKRNEYIKNYVYNYLSDFKNPLKNIYEYSDNIIRCLRLTKYIYIRGGGYYVDLEPRRMIEIKSILQNDDGSAKNYTIEEYQEYLGDYNSYKLPFEIQEKLIEINTDIISDINELNKKLNKAEYNYEITDKIEHLKEQTDSLRKERLKLQNEYLRIDYDSPIKIDEAINALSNIGNLGLKPSVALEKWVNIALNIIDDSVLIKPNCPLGDDNEPTFTAPAKVPDIECFYENFYSICEVTMLTGRNQWFNEGQPVMRHLRDFENKHPDKPNYCLFVAPKVHQDTVNIFWTAVKYEYEGKSQRIIPITITDFINLLTIIKLVKNKEKKILNTDI